MNATKGIELIQKQLDEFEELMQVGHESQAVEVWRKTTRSVLKTVFPTNQEYANTFVVAPFKGHDLWGGGGETDQQAFANGMSRLQGTLKAALNELNMKIDLEPTEKEGLSTISSNAMSLLRTVLLRFHAVAKSLQQRHGGRETLQITDEYDVQDLLLALLRLHFDDIRREEWSPSYAGGSSRMDFLLKKEKIVVETKMTREGLRDSKIGEELIVDQVKYNQHPDCESLVCFVYDPGEFLKNPSGLERDLAKNSGPATSVIVVPRTF